MNEIIFEHDPSQMQLSIDQIVFEQDPPQMPGDEGDPNQQGQEQEQQGPDIDAEILPLKKYYLTQELTKVRNQLYRAGITRDDLNLVVKFQNFLSYDTLVILADKVFNNIQDDLRSIKNEQKT